MVHCELSKPQKDPRKQNKSKGKINVLVKNIMRVNLGKMFMSTTLGLHYVRY